MKRIGWTGLGLALATLLSGAAEAHHAMEYIEMESASTPHQGEWVFHLHYDYMVDDQENPRLDHWEFTPGLSWGILDRLMLDVHTHFAQFGSDHIIEEEREQYEPDGPSPFLEAVAGSLQLRLSDGWPVELALVGSLELPLGRAEELLGSEDPVVGGLLVAGWEFGAHGNLTANLAYEVEGEEDDFSWALGVKNPLSADPHGIAAGLEVMGSVEEVSDNWSVLPGVYFPLSGSGTILKTGLEAGRADGADTLRANVTLMHRF